MYMKQYEACTEPRLEQQKPRLVAVYNTNLPGGGNFEASGRCFKVLAGWYIGCWLWAAMRNSPPVPWASDVAEKGAEASTMVAVMSEIPCYSDAPGLSCCARARPILVR